MCRHLTNGIMMYLVRSFPVSVARVSVLSYVGGKIRLGGQNSLVAPAPHWAARVVRRPPTTAVLALPVTRQNKSEKSCGRRESQTPNRKRKVGHDHRNFLYPLPVIAWGDVTGLYPTTNKVRPRAPGWRHFRSFTPWGTRFTLPVVSRVVSRLRSIFNFQYMSPLRADGLLTCPVLVRHAVVFLPRHKCRVVLIGAVRLWRYPQTHIAFFGVLVALFPYGETVLILDCSTISPGSLTSRSTGRTPANTGSASLDTVLYAFSTTLRHQESLLGTIRSNQLKYGTFGKRPSVTHAGLVTATLQQSGVVSLPGRFLDDFQVLVWRDCLARRLLRVDTGYSVFTAKCALFEAFSFGITLIGEWRPISLACAVGVGETTGCFASLCLPTPWSLSILSYSMVPRCSDLICGSERVLDGEAKHFHCALLRQGDLLAAPRIVYQQAHSYTTSRLDSYMYLPRATGHSRLRLSPGQQARFLRSASFFFFLSLPPPPGKLNNRQTPKMATLPRPVVIRSQPETIPRNSSSTSQQNGDTGQQHDVTLQRLAAYVPGGRPICRALRSQLSSDDYHYIKISQTTSHGLSASIEDAQGQFIPEERWKQGSAGAIRAMQPRPRGAPSPLSARDFKRRPYHFIGGMSAAKFRAGAYNSFACFRPMYYETQQCEEAIFSYRANPVPYPFVALVQQAVPISLSSPTVHSHAFSPVAAFTVVRSCSLPTVPEALLKLCFQDTPPPRDMNNHFYYMTESYITQVNTTNDAAFLFYHLQLRGDTVALAASLLASHQGDPGSISGRVTPDFRTWESCRTMPLVGGGGFSR
ncbi:hypothetical protein PR048_003568 [Dryococelus australis]|uniref:Uncharacterized protein n=1 Tax=Dryococelus australis TaxID=614101 RepID=A0ABQ9IQB8_9NEOP|nr:hypothetical protein PR048_003568 [Dryococelus australis]